MSSSAAGLCLDFELRGLMVSDVTGEGVAFATGLISGGSRTATVLSSLSASTTTFLGDTDLVLVLADFVVVPACEGAGVTTASWVVSAAMSSSSSSSFSFFSFLLVAAGLVVLASVVCAGELPEATRSVATRSVAG